MISNDRHMLERYLLESLNYFEWGSGNSTIIASKCNLEQCFSVETDKKYMEDVKKSVEDNVTFLYVEMGTKPYTWGYPSGECNFKAKQSYTSQLTNQLLDVGKHFDLVLIDGRFRVACCLKSFSHLNKKSIILFDDFRGRSYYHDVLDYYNILETGQQMYALVKKPGIQPPSSNMIQKFEVDER